MPQAFLILLCGGALFASAVPKATDVTLRWLRLCGIIAMTMLGLSIFFWSRQGLSPNRTELMLYMVTAAAIAVQLALVQTAKPQAARPISLAGFAVSLILGQRLLGSPMNVPAPAALVGCAGVAIMSGLVLMEMLLGHAYLTAATMTMSPFRRMNLSLAGTMALRMFFGICAMLMEPRWPVEMFWTRQGFLVGVRWLVGLLVPAVFVYMTHDCIKRRATQSATGILYVAGVLIFIGEMIALNLTRGSGLPF